jgi:phospholipid/cholesterol/gamma-HCH transport system substrate-binding protein
MSSAPPLRHVREIVGVFVLVALAMALAALVFIGRGRALFESRAELQVTFPAQRAAVIRPGVPVRLTGEVVGRVVATAREGDVIRARLSILRPAREVLRSDARATLRVPLGGLVGELGIELDTGGAATPWPEGRVIAGLAEGDPADKARETVEQIGVRVPLLLERTQSILDRSDAILGQVQRARTAENADRLVQTLERLARSAEREETVAHAARVLAETELLLRGVREGKGTVGRLATDPELYDRVSTLLADLHATWSKLDALVGASANLAAKAGELAERARTRTQDLEALYGQVQVLVLQANRALEAINETWPFRGPLPDPATPAPPAVLDLPPPTAPTGPAAPPEGRP